jgi:hypothetical protein
MYIVRRVSKVQQGVVFELNKQLREIQEDTWIEFYEAATPDKLSERGLM